MRQETPAGDPLRHLRYLSCLAAFALLAGCEGRLSAGAESVAGAAPVQDAALLTERDVEAPEVFSTEESALWDGRPSLGGIWVAAPGVTEPERVIIRNAANGKSVVGALFKRERDSPGPALQLSSEAAAALDILAGSPTEVAVVALRREALPEELEAAAVPLPGAEVSSRSLAPAAGVTSGPTEMR